MRNCPQCNQSYTDDINYCLQDGTPLPVNNYADAPTVSLPGPYSDAPTQVLASIPTAQQVVKTKAAKWPFVVIGGLAALLIAVGLFAFLPKLRNEKTDDPGVIIKPAAPASNAQSGGKPSSNSGVAAANAASNTVTNFPANASSLNYNSPTGHYAGDWISKMTSYGADVTITEVAGKIKGQIVWTLRSSPNPQKTGKTGMTATEYIDGTYDPKSHAIQLKGFRKDDPNEIIILDTYDLTVAEDNQTIVGKSIHGEFILRRQ